MTEQPSDPVESIRASNADREAVVRRLNDAFSEGRLDMVELEERVSAAYAAKTLGDLRPLTGDLPPPNQPAPPARPAEVERPAAHRPERSDGPGSMLRWAWYGGGSIVAINFVIWAAVSLSAGDWVYPWWIWVLVAYVCGAFGGRRWGGHGGHRRRERPSDE